MNDAIERWLSASVSWMILINTPTNRCSDKILLPTNTNLLNKVYGTFGISNQFQIFDKKYNLSMDFRVTLNTDTIKTHMEIVLLRVSITWIIRIEHLLSRRYLIYDSILHIMWHTSLIVSPLLPEDETTAGTVCSGGSCAQRAAAIYCWWTRCQPSGWVEEDFIEL